MQLADNLNNYLVLRIRPRFQAIWLADISIDTRISGLCVEKRVIRGVLESTSHLRPDCFQE